MDKTKSKGSDLVGNSNQSHLYPSILGFYFHPLRLHATLQAEASILFLVSGGGSLTKRLEIPVL